MVLSISVGTEHQKVTESEIKVLEVLPEPSQQTIEEPPALLQEQQVPLLKSIQEQPASPQEPIQEQQVPLLKSIQEQPASPQEPIQEQPTPLQELMVLSPQKKQAATPEKTGLFKK
jgi:hypothetical protein